MKETQIQILFKYNLDLTKGLVTTEIRWYIRKNFKSTINMTEESYLRLFEKSCACAEIKFFQRI